MDEFGDLQDLYQQVILDHGRNPRNFRTIEADARSAEGFNPLCGDQVKVFVKLDQDKIGDCAFTGKGCAICTASASMMTQALKNLPVSEASRLFEAFHKMVTGDDDHGNLGKLAVFEGVRKYPIRVKCATLPWHTLKNSLDDRQSDIATTE